MKKQRISRQLREDLNALFEDFENNIYPDNKQFDYYRKYCNKTVGLVFAFYEYIETLSDIELASVLNSNKYIYSQKEIFNIRKILSKSEEDWIDNNQKDTFLEHLYNN